MAVAFASVGTVLLGALGETVTLVGDQFRVDCTAIVNRPWTGTTAQGIPIDRTDTTATVATTDIDGIPVVKGAHLEVGDLTYRILGLLEDVDSGTTVLQLAQEA